MKKTVLALTLALSSFNYAFANEVHSADLPFIESISHLGINQTNWDSGHAAKLLMKNAYKMTPYVQLETKGKNYQEFGKAKGLDLTQIQSFDFDGDHNAEIIARDRLNIESMVITKNGQLIDSFYWNGTSESSTHLQMSVSKSFTAITASILAAEGKIDMSKPVTHYLPELIGSGFEQATVQQVADMRSGIKINFSEGKLWDDRMTNVQEWNGKNNYPHLTSILDFASLVDHQQNEVVGTHYNYQCINTEVLGKVIEKASKKPLSKVIEERLWSKVGFKHPAKWQSNSDGELVASGGLNATTADVARMMDVLVNEGKNYKGEQVVPKDFIENILKGNDEVKQAWANGKESKLADDAWYKDQIRVFNIEGHTFLAFVGIHGQLTIGEPATKTVIAMNAAQDERESPRSVLMTFFGLVPALLDAVNK